MNEPKKIWMVRAGRRATYIDDFIDGGQVGIGSDELGVPKADPSKEELERSLRSAFPTESPGTISNWASQLRRFHVEIEVGDVVTTYDPTASRDSTGRRCRNSLPAF